jgi:hypothetical protein
VRDGLEPVGAREDGEHSRQLERRRTVDATDASVRVERAHEGRVRLVSQIEVVAEASGALDEALVLLAEDGLTDALVATWLWDWRNDTRRYSANCAARQRSAAPSPSFSRISSNFMPTSVRAA